MAEGVNVAPPPAALVHAGQAGDAPAAAALGAPVPRFTAVENVDDVDAFAAAIGGPVVVKTVRGGYDGRGVVLTRDLAEAREVVAGYLADGWRCCSRSGLDAPRAVGPGGAVAVQAGRRLPVVETVQRDGICVTVLAPAPGCPGNWPPGRAAGLRLADELGVVGVLAVELFETTDGALLVNELAMRPHNSGHWTMNGAVTSQFEQHLRAVLDYPLGDTRAIAPVTVMANVLGAPETPAMAMDERLHHLFGRIPDAHVHLYGKGRAARARSAT